MWKKYLPMLISGLLLFTVATPPTFAGQVSTEQTKVKVQRLGVGEKAKATIKVKDGSKIKGYISEVNDSDFVVRDRKTDAPTRIRYEDVVSVDSNRGHSTAKHIAIGVGIGVGAFLLVIAAVISHLD